MRVVSDLLVVGRSERLLGGHNDYPSDSSILHHSVDCCRYPGIMRDPRPLRLLSLMQALILIPYRGHIRRKTRLQQVPLPTLLSMA